MLASSARLNEGVLPLTLLIGLPFRRPQAKVCREVEMVKHLKTSNNGEVLHEATRAPSNGAEIEIRKR